MKMNPEFYKRIPGMFANFFSNYRAAWRKRRGANYRLRLIKYTAILLSMVWIMPATILPLNTMALVLAAPILIGLPLLAFLTLWRQPRRLQHPKAGQFEFKVGAGVLFGLTIPLLINVGLYSVLYVEFLSDLIALLCYLVLGLIVIWTVWFRLRNSESWVYEVQAADVYLWLPAGALEVYDNIRYKVAPGARVDPDRTAKFLQQPGITKELEELIEKYIQYNCPEFLEHRILTSFLSGKRSIEDEVRTIISQVTEKSRRQEKGIFSITLLEQLKAYKQTLAQASGDATPDEEDAKSAKKSPYLDTLIEVAEFFQHARSERSVPMLQIRPGDRLWGIWNKRTQIWTKRKFKDIGLQGGGQLDLQLTLAVEYEPEKTTAVEARKGLYDLVAKERKKYIERTEGAVEGDDELVSYEKFVRGSRSGMIGTLVRGHIPNVYEDYTVEELLDNTVRKAAGKLAPSTALTKRIPFLRSALGMSLLGWSLMLNENVKGELAAAVEKAQAGRKLYEGRLGDVELTEQFDPEEVERMALLEAVRTSLVDPDPLMAKIAQNTRQQGGSIQHPTDEVATSAAQAEEQTRPGGTEADVPPSEKEPSEDAYQSALERLRMRRRKR